MRERETKQMVFHQCNMTVKVKCTNNKENDTWIIDTSIFRLLNDAGIQTVEFRLYCLFNSFFSNEPPTFKVTIVQCEEPFFSFFYRVKIEAVSLVLKESEIHHNDNSFYYDIGKQLESDESVDCMTDLNHDYLKDPTNGFANDEGHYSLRATVMIDTERPIEDDLVYTVK